MSQKSKYNETDMQSALLDVQMGVTVHTAAKRWRIPKTTLLYRTRGSTNRAAVSAARQKVSKAHEDNLALWVVSQAALGFPVSHRELWDFARRVLEKSGATGPPGKQWVSCFLRRHPEITKVDGILYETKNAPSPAKTGLQGQRPLSPVADQPGVGQHVPGAQQTPVGQQSQSEPESTIEHQVPFLQDALAGDRGEQQRTSNKDPGAQQPSTHVAPVTKQEPCFVLVDAPTS